MRVSILTTDGGPHSAEKWAATTAGQIIEVAAQSEQEIEGRRLELKILDILEKYHAELQVKENESLATKGSEGLSHNFDPNVYVNIDEVVQEIVEAGKTSKWSSHFDNVGVVANIKEVLLKDFATSIQISRFWHCDRNPGDEKAQAFKSVYHKS